VAAAKSANATCLMSKSQRLTTSIARSRASTRCVLSKDCRFSGVRVASATSAQAGWLHARCEATPTFPASPCQYTPPPAINLVTDIPKQLSSLIVKLVVFSSRWVCCVVA
jgi:hypothetical protein